MEATVLKVSKKETSNGNWIHTLGVTKKSMLFGQEQIQVNKYLIALKGAVKVGETAEINLANYEVTTQESQVMDDDGTERTVRATWLYLKKD